MPTGLPNNRTILRIKTMLRDRTIPIHTLTRPNAGVIVRKRHIHARPLEPLELPASRPSQARAGVPIQRVARVAVIIDVGDRAVEIDLRQQIPPLEVAVLEGRRPGCIALPMYAAADVAEGVVGVGELVDDYVARAGQDRLSRQLVLLVVVVLVLQLAHRVTPPCDLTNRIISVLVTQVRAADAVGHVLDL